MIQIKNKSNCSGCSACAMSCPKNCIHMEFDQEGFLYPKIDLQICINCGKCDRVCPIINHKPSKNYLPNAVVGASKDSTIRKYSTSGGFFGELAKAVIDNAGIVYGVLWNDDFLTIHSGIRRKEDLQKICRSKYVQSNVGYIYKDVKENLIKNNLVLFSGTACQIAGLKSFLGKEYDNLLTCDVVCRGVNSPKLWKKYLSELEKTYNSEINYIGFREKFSSFHKSRLVIYFKNGKKHMPSTNVEWISRFFSLAISIRPSCYQCSFKGFERASDFTMFDCWNLSRLVEGKHDDDKGYTNVLVHTAKGDKWLKKIKEQFDYSSIDALKAKKYDGIMLENCVSMPKRRNEFFSDLDNMTIEQIGKKYAPIPRKILIRECIKNVMLKCKLLKL